MDKKDDSTVKYMHLQEDWYKVSMENNTLKSKVALLESELSKNKVEPYKTKEEPEYYVEVPGSLGWYRYDASDGNLTVVPEMLYATAFTDNMIKHFGLEHCQRGRK